MGDRAQTSIDFAIAMGVFLVVLTTIVAFMPTITQPFTGGQQNPLLADRLAAQVTDDTLADIDNPSVLDTTCTHEFFRDSGLTTCHRATFNVGDNVTTKLGVERDVFVNVSIQQNVSGGPTPDLVCGEEVGGQIDLSEPPCTSGILLADGPKPPNTVGSITTARRYAMLDHDDDVYVVVRVWT